MSEWSIRIDDGEYWHHITASCPDVPEQTGESTVRLSPDVTLDFDYMKIVHIKQHGQ